MVGRLDDVNPDMVETIIFTAIASGGITLEELRTSQIDITIRHAKHKSKHSETEPNVNSFLDCVTFSEPPDPVANSFVADEQPYSKGLLLLSFIVESFPSTAMELTSDEYDDLLKATQLYFSRHIQGLPVQSKRLHRSRAVDFVRTHLIPKLEALFGSLGFFFDCFSETKKGCELVDWRTRNVKKDLESQREKEIVLGRKQMASAIQEVYDTAGNLKRLLTSRPHTDGRDKSFKVLL